MDVTPQLLQDIEFREKVRGYHPDDVDDFLERVGVAFSELVDRLRQANERADAAEAALADRAEVDDSTLSRTLVLAQRTADAAIAEAKAEAELTRSEAKSEAERLVAEAEAEAQRLVSTARLERDAVVRAAEADAREQAAAVTGPIEEEIARLEARREEIVEQSGGLEAWLAAQRVKLESVATDLQQILEDPDRLRPDPAPEVVPESDDEDPAMATGLTLVESDRPAEAGGAPSAEAESAPSPDDWVVPASPDTGTDEAVVAEDVPAESEVGPELGLSSVQDDQDAVADVGDIDEGETDGDQHDPDELIVDLDGVEADDLDAVEADDLDDRPSRVSVVRSSVQPDATEVVDQPTGASDSFLEELRRAVEAPTDLVESDEDRALSAFFEHEEEEPKRRFGRRR